MRSLLRRRVPVAAAAIVAATAVALAFHSAPVGAIANGTPARPGAYGFAARFTFTGVPAPDGSTYGSTYDSACSGALVAPRWVVTAGHCFHDAARRPVSGRPLYRTSTVTVGRTQLSAPGGAVRTVIEVRQAPGGADVALARLDRPVTVVGVLRLTTNPPLVGETVRLAGWGATSSTGAPSTTLRTGTFRVATVTAAIAGMTGLTPAADTSACPYDSGAPYFRESVRGPELLAVESEGPDCPHPGAETTYRADVLALWITGQVTGDAHPPIRGRARH